MTDDKIIEVANATRTAEPGDNGYILPISFARAIIAADRTQRQVGQEHFDLHAAIMNLTCPETEELDREQRLAYKSGHKNARHAAAELAIKGTAPQPAQANKDAEIAALTAERDNAVDLWTVAHAERSAEMMRGAEQEVEIAALRAELERLLKHNALVKEADEHYCFDEEPTRALLAIAHAVQP